MKITSIATSSFRLPLAPPTQRDACLVELHAESNCTGIAIAFVDPAETEALARSHLLGAESLATVSLGERMLNTKAAPEARAALDMALWDLNAKAKGEPLWRMLGGSMSRVNTHLGGCSAAMRDAELAEHIYAMTRSHGFRGVVLDACDSVAQNAERLALVSKELRVATHDPTLMIRSRNRWTAEETERHAQTLEESCDLTWLESPPLNDDVASLKRISSNVRAAVCAGGTLDSPRAYFPHLQARAVDVVQIDIARCGITGALQIADAAFGFELPVTLLDSIGNIAAHVATAIPNCMSMEVTQPSTTGTITSAVRIENGWAIVGDAPGLGLQVSNRGVS